MQLPTAAPAVPDSAALAADTAVQIASVDDAVALIYDKVEGWWTSAVRLLPNAIVAILIAIAFWLLARLLAGASERALRRSTLHAPIRHLIAGIVFVVVFAGGIFVALGVLGLDRTVTSLLAGVGIVGLVLGIAFQDIAANFFAGILLSFRHPFEVGHIIETNGHMGTVQDVNLRATTLRVFTGQVVRIPNKEVLNNPIINYTETGERRVDLTVGVSYASDLERVRQVAVTAVEALPSRHAARPVELFYEGFGDSSINFQIRFWMDFARQPDFLAARSDAVMAIKRAFDAHDIVIPFPIRTLDFGIRGGETIGEAMRPVLGR